MGATSSVPAVAAEPKVRIDSPTTIESSSGFHMLELHGPTASTLFLCLVTTMITVCMALCVYRAFEKRQKIKRAKIEDEARKENITFPSPLTKTIPYRWNPAGPTVQEHHALPLLMAMARRLEEGEFHRGAGRLTEVWDGQSTIPHLMPHVTSPPKRPRKVLEDELEEIVTGVAAAATAAWEDGETPPKRLRSARPPLQ